MSNNDKDNKQGCPSQTDATWCFVYWYGELEFISRWRNLWAMGVCLKEMFPTQNMSYQSPSEKSGEWLTGLNPVPDDGHVVISIRPWLLMPEAQRMKEFVLNCCNPVTVGSNGELLQALLPVSHWGPATNMEIRLEDKSVKYMPPPCHDKSRMSLFNRPFFEH